MFGLDPSTMLAGLLKNPAVASKIEEGSAFVKEIAERFVRIEQKQDEIIEYQAATLRKLNMIMDRMGNFPHDVITAHENPKLIQELLVHDNQNK